MGINQPAMKTIVLAISLLLSSGSISIANASGESESDPTLRQRLKAALDKQVSRYLFNTGEEDLVNGEALVDLKVADSGQIEVLSVETSNPRIQSFIERRLNSRFIRKDLAVSDEVFRYQLVFKKQ
jgi:hypothetical protein